MVRILLLTNLGCTLSGMNVDDFFPRCYDLSDTRQADELIANNTET